MEKNITTLSDFHIRSKYGISILAHTEPYTIVHNHTYYEIHIQKKGTILHFFNNNVETLKQGDIVLISPQLTHSLNVDKSAPQDFEYVNLPVQSTIFLEIAKALDMPRLNSFINNSEALIKIHLENDEFDKLMAEYDKLQRIPNKDKPDFSISVKFFLLSILSVLHDKTSEFATPLPGWLTDFLLKINNPAAYKLTVNELCEYTFYSHSHLCKLFKQYMGVSLTHYFTQLKLNYAAYLLRNTDYSISYITGEIGLDNQGYFSGLFKKSFRETPLSYRKNNKSV